MKWLLTVAIMCATAQSASAQDENNGVAVPPVLEGKTWNLVWHDEFDGAKIDESKWEIMPDAPRKDGWWMQKAVSLDGKGHLVISTLKEGDRYIDGCVRTKGKFEHSFGYYVARVKLQEQPGHWSAFWIMGDGVGKVGSGGRDGTEIDIYEKPWLDDRVQHTLHWDGYGKDHKSKAHVAKVPGVMQGWHTFGLWWKPDEYIFYVDGKETWRTKASGVCQVPEYIKLSDEVGKWGGDISKAKLPDAFLVDYVRVYDLVEKPAAKAPTMQEITRLVREYAFSEKPKLNPRTEFRIRRLEVKGLWEQLKLQVFKVEYVVDGQSFNGFDCTYHRGKLSPLGQSFGGYGLMSGVLCKGAFYYTYSFGSGIHRCHIGKIQVVDGQLKRWDSGGFENNDGVDLFVEKVDENSVRVVAGKFKEFNRWEAGNEFGRIKEVNTSHLKIIAPDGKAILPEFPERQ